MDDPIRYVILSIVLFALVFSIARAVRVRFSVAKIFGQKQVPGPDISTINDALISISLQKENPMHAFTGNRVSNILIRGRLVSVVDGTVGYARANSKGGSMWHQEGCVFVITPSNEREWIEQNPDLYISATSGSDWSVFWIKLPALIAQLSD